MKYKMPILETDRLILKRGTLEDYKKVYEYDFTRLRDINGELEYVKHNQPELLNSYLDYYDEEDNVLDYIVFLKENNEPIGNLIFDRYDKELNSLEISCNLHPDYWGNRYMPEAILKVMDYIYSNLNIDNIVYGYAEENIKSKKLSDKIGFTYLKEETVYYNRLNKDIKEIKTIMNKEDFYRKYKKVR